MTTIENGQEQLHYPAARSCPYRTPAVYGQRREDEPVSRVIMADGRPAWLLTRYEDVRAVLADPRFSADRLADGFPSLAVGQREGLLRQPPFMISMDGEEHATNRRKVLREFGFRRVQMLEPRIQEIVDDAIDTVLALPQPVDLVENLSLTVPTLLLAELIGADHGDHEYFTDLVARMLWRGSTGEERVEISGGLRRYFDTLIDDKEANPGEDILSRLIVAQREEDGEVDHEHLVSLAQLLLIAGYESSASMISLGIFALLDDPEQLAVIMADPSRTPEAVEEMLRFFSILDVAAGRVATEDVEIRGVRIRAGEGVMASVFAANRDPGVFADPETLDLQRGDRRHLAFGHGPHQCLGASLARVELRIVFDTVFRRIPTLRLAVPPDELPFKYDSLSFGLDTLPVVW